MVRIREAVIAFSAGLALAFGGAGDAAAQEKSTAVKLVDQFNTLFGNHPGYRANHAKGFVFEGSFQPSPKAAALSRAPHLQKKATKVTVRFSDASGLPEVPDAAPPASPRGMAIKFDLPGGGDTDIVAISLKGFPVATGEEFLEFLQAAGASGPNAPKPTPVEQFLASHPNSAKIVAIPQPMPVSYGTLPYYGLNAFKFTNAKGKVQFGRYRIVPVGKTEFVTDEAAAKRGPNALDEALVAQLAKGPVRFKLLLQLAREGDPLNNATLIWPDSNPTVELGVITIAKPVPDSKTAEKALLFTPTNLPDGIEPSDDPLIAARGEAYAESFSRRQ
jgi:catalase